MCVNCVGLNSCHQLKCEKCMLNRGTICANTCKNRDVHMRFYVFELSEHSWLNVTTKMCLKLYEMLFELSYILSYKMLRKWTGWIYLSYLFNIWFCYVTWWIGDLQIIFNDTRSIRIEPETSLYIGCWKI